MERGKNNLIKPGNPTPLGSSLTPDGVNIALFFPSTQELSIGLFNSDGLLKKISLDPTTNKTGDIWHVELKDLSKDIFYAFYINGQWIADPYAKQLHRSPQWGEGPQTPLADALPPEPFDWKGDCPLHLPFEKLIIYEMHVRGFTKDKSSQVKYPGTFLGLIEKIPYLKELGITAVELLPIFAFDEMANSHHNPITNEKLYNYWGYSTDQFFAPMAPYGTVGNFKTMVKALHKAGIEVILDVVFNHVGDASLHLIDKKTYFILDEHGNHTNYSGCGNTVNCNHPVVIELILSSLRYWVTEMHVDGFRFDLASIFCRGEKGEVLDHPPLIKALNEDPTLSLCKFIAEAWDCAGLYQVGSFPGNNRWAEWNGKFRDVARRFLKGTAGQAGSFASIMTGSQDLYGNGRAPYHSINFITAHDGFTLRDLVSYNQKHNEDNGEGNRDGNDTNDSWNCGVEGLTENADITALRKRQMRNFFITLGLSIGTPMLLMGDEYGHTRDGNNNAYALDNQKNYFLWDHTSDPFVQKVFALRKKSSLFQRTTFLSDQEITWHGHQPNAPNWNDDSRFVAYTLYDKKNAYYFAFNAHYEPAELTLPSLPEKKKWKRLIDTALPNAPEDRLETHYYLPAHSALVLVSS